MKAKIWVLCTVLVDENAPAVPAVFADEAEATRAASGPAPVLSRVRHPATHDLAA
jgi:hypothetical protein